MAWAGLATARARVERCRSGRGRRIYVTTGSPCHGWSSSLWAPILPGLIHFLNPYGTVACCGLSRVWSFFGFADLLGYTFQYLKIYLWQVSNFMTSKTFVELDNHDHNPFYNAVILESLKVPSWGERTPLPSPLCQESAFYYHDVPFLDTEHTENIVRCRAIALAF